MYPDKTIIQKDTCTFLFIAAVFTIAKTWKHPKCPSTDEWVKKMWCIHTWALLSHKKWNNAISQQVKVKLLSHVRLFATSWTVAYQAPQSMGFSRQEFWSGLPFPSPRDLPNPGIEPGSPTLQVDALPSEPPGKPNMDATRDFHTKWSRSEKKWCHLYHVMSLICGI